MEGTGGLATRGEGAAGKVRGTLKGGADIECFERNRRRREHRKQNRVPERQPGSRVTNGVGKRVLAREAFPGAIGEVAEPRGLVPEDVRALVSPARPTRPCSGSATIA